MKRRRNPGFLLALAALVLGLVAAAPAVRAEPSPAARLLDELRHVRPDPPNSYKVSDIYLDRDAIRIHLQHGMLVFLTPVEGRITGAIFEGAGEILVIPPDRGEREQMLKFTGSPILTESFASAYFRFTDGTANELLAKIRAGAGRPQYAADVVERWDKVLAAAAGAHALRMLQDFLSPQAATYFFAGINGEHLGTFSVVVDGRRAEQVLVGQIRWAQNRPYYDVWTSFARSSGPAPPPNAHAQLYDIDVTLTPQYELQSASTVSVELTAPRPRVLLFRLSRLLTVDDVTALPGDPADAGPGQPVEFFRDVTLNQEEARYRGGDAVLVLLPASLAADDASPNLRLRFRYHGTIITDVGNGVLQVDDRDAWYPILDPAEPAHYQLSFRYPRSLDIVATGTLKETREEGEWKVSHWTTSVPLPVAGFNVGHFERRVVGQGETPVSVFANRTLEPQLAAARPPPRPSTADTPSLAPTGDSTSVLADALGEKVSGALKFYSNLFGPVPYPDLKVTPIPGELAQGYSGLLYLSTVCFLSSGEQSHLGLDERTREHFSDLAPAHETAHQWWGNWIWVPDYRSRWLAEALATYSAFLYLEQQSGPEVTERWLARYRRDLLQLDADGHPLESAGALTLGIRLVSSKDPAAYTGLIYSKGPWVLHMLRMLLRNPENGSDAVFLGVLRNLAEVGGKLTTEKFQRSLEAALPAYADIQGNGSLAWFFDQWVRDTGIPLYHFGWSVTRRSPTGWQVEGTVAQSDVPSTFTAMLPIYARVGTALRPLGRIRVTGDSVAFRLVLSEKPDEILFDPYHTTLFLTEADAPPAPPQQPTATAQHVIY